MLYGELNTITLSDGSAIQGLKVQIPHPRKTAVIRRPTDKELDATKEKFRKLLKKDPASTDKMPYLDLFNGIRLDQDGEDFDEYEAEHIIGWAIQATADSETIGEELAVTITTPTCTVRHFLRFPTFKEMQTKTGAALFDALFLRQEGYATGCEIPAQHRELAMREVIKNHLSIDPFVSTDPNA